MKHFTNKLLFLLFDLMLVAAISCFEVFGVVYTDKSVCRVLCFNVDVLCSGKDNFLTYVTLQ